jgi:biotin carboxylase
MAVRRLLIIGAGIEQVRAYQLAREMGLEVAGTDRNPDAPAFAYADHRIVADTHDTRASVDAARRFAAARPLHGVMTIAHDVPVTVAAVAAALGLPHLPLESARLAEDKLAMKERFARDGVPVPAFRQVASADEVRACIAEWGLPVVTKPVDSCGARGVMRITAAIDPNAAFARSLACSRSGRVIAERFVPGLQLSTEGMVWRGECFTASWSERNYDRLDQLAPFVIEDGGVLPATLTDPEVRSVCEVMQRAAASLGITDGPVKGDLVLTPDGPVVIELAARLSGGYLCTDQIPWARGVDLVRQTIRVALGEELDPRELVPEHRGFIGVRFFFPEPGVVESVAGFEELGAEPWILKRTLYVEPGDTIEPTTAHPTRAGFVFTTGTTPEEAEARAVECVRRVAIRTRPARPAH